MWLCNALLVLIAGGRPRRVTPRRPLAARELDALLVGGGDDIAFDLDGGSDLEAGPGGPKMRVDRERDAMERQLIAEAERHGLPILGICRGAQMINAVRGGSLHAEITKAFPGLRNRRSPLPHKSVEVAPQSRLGRLLRCVRCRVNALHHQAIDKVGEGLAVVARDDWGMVQAIEAEAKKGAPPFLIGVQWHPEFLLFSAAQRRLFGALVADARRLRTAAGVESR